MLNSSDFEGELVGGNLSVLISSFGTKYAPKLMNKVLFLELKRKKGSRVSKEQTVFLDKVNTYNYAIGTVAYGWEDGVRILEELDK